MKAILVLNEMPNSCKDCRLKYFDNGDDAYYGGVTERCVIDGSQISVSGRYDDCPLRPLPKTAEVPDDAYVSDYLDFDLGWNACLKEIEKND